MGMTVENLSDGAFRKRMLVVVAAGWVLARRLRRRQILFDLPLATLLFVGYPGRRWR